MAPLRHADRIEQCPLSGVTRKTLEALARGHSQHGKNKPDQRYHRTNFPVASV
jgi:hypothetical protein